MGTGAVDSGNAFVEAAAALVSAVVEAAAGGATYGGGTDGEGGGCTRERVKEYDGAAPCARMTLIARAKKDC